MFVSTLFSSDKLFDCIALEIRLAYVSSVITFSLLSREDAFDDKKLLLFIMTEPFCDLSSPGLSSAIMQCQKAFDIIIVIRKGKIVWKHGPHLAEF